MEEEWKPIDRLPGYEASSLGRIRGPDGSVRKLQKQAKGYPMLMVSFVAHRLVCEAFHGPPPFPGAQALHGPDHNKNNILPENLRWGTSQENSDDTISSGRANFLKGEDHGRALITWDIVNAARVRNAAGEYVKAIWRDIGEPLGIGYAAFFKAVKGVTWKEAPCES